MSPCESLHQLKKKNKKPPCSVRACGQAKPPSSEWTKPRTVRQRQQHIKTASNRKRGLTTKRPNYSIQTKSIEPIDRRANQKARERLLTDIVFSSNRNAIQNPAGRMSFASLRVRASWDTIQRLPYNPNAPRNPDKHLNPKPKSVSNPKTAAPTVKLTAESVSELLKRKATTRQGVIEKLSESYLGYDVWLPNPPKMEKPRSVYNAATLAYIGDSIFELYARRHFLFPPLSIEEYNDRVMAVVRCEAQDAMLQKLLNDNFLSAEERDVLRWGKNVGSAKTRTIKRAGVAVYNRASSLETLVGYLYLTDVNRLDEIMLKLGFSTGCSSQMIADKPNSEQAEKSIQNG